MEKSTQPIIEEASSRKKILDIVTKKLELSADEITDVSSFSEDLGADSLDTIEIIMDVEEKFQITISDLEGEKIRTFGDLVALVDRLTN